MTGYREKALAEYEEVCYVCGVDERIVIHHRDGDRTNHSLENLLPLCMACHAKVHNRHPDVAGLVRELGHRPLHPDRTQISVSEPLADELYSRMERGERYDDVIWRLMEQAAGTEHTADG